MGRLCGGAHEISGIKAPIFLCGWVRGGGMCGGGVGDKVRSLVLMFVFVSLYVIRNNVEHLCNSNLLLYSVYMYK